jgi:formylglycine-generating enzyme required for sulfatase activity
LATLKGRFAIMTKQCEKTMCSRRSNRLIRLAGVAALGVATAAAGWLMMPATPARAESPAAAAGEKSFTQKLAGSEVSFDMVAIPGGTVKIGSPDTEKKRKADEGPQVEVQIEPFYMGKHEVTWDLYNEFLKNYNQLATVKDRPVIPIEKLADAVSYPTPIYDLEAGPILQRMGGREGKLPAVIMSHHAAKQFCKWLSAKTGRFYRLPTEAEWEYAARGGAATAYHFGDDGKKLEDYGWFVDNSPLADGDPGYHEVGQKKPNQFGLYDMHGNVAEIVMDQHDAEWYKKLAAKGGPVAWRDAIRWPDNQYPRIAKGGGYESEAEDCRVAFRQRITNAQNTRDPQEPKSPYWWTEGFSIGFRLVSPVKEPTPEEKAKFWDIDNERVLDVIKNKYDRQIMQPVKDVATKK